MNDQLKQNAIQEIVAMLDMERDRYRLGETDEGITSFKSDDDSVSFVYEREDGTSYEARFVPAEVVERKVQPSRDWVLDVLLNSLDHPYLGELWPGRKTVVRAKHLTDYESDQGVVDVLVLNVEDITTGTTYQARVEIGMIDVEEQV